METGPSIFDIPQSQQLNFNCALIERNYLQTLLNYLMLCFSDL